MLNRLKRYLANDGGMAAIEYAVIGSFMGLALIPLLPGISSSIETRLMALADGF